MKKFFSPEPVIFSVNGGTPEGKSATIANFKNAFSLGADAVFTTIGITSDGKLVAGSESDTGGFDRGVSGGMTLAELKQKSPASDLFPELNVILEEFPDGRFCFNLAGDNQHVAELFCDAVKKADATDRIMIGFAGGKIIGRIRRTFPGMATSFSIAGFLGFYMLFRSGLLYFFRNFKADAFITPESIGISHIGNQGLIKQAKEKGIHVFMLNVNEKNHVKRLVEIGADGFFTENLSVVMEALSDKHKTI
ncbi:MAG: hypothetical protein MUD12_05725 [Spirochaetes bacterium]|jgi:glycerophosphoryl diester phosphodiesterase|nr:hypothetical protein [Spirochaetota bacterium]